MVSYILSQFQRRPWRSLAVVAGVAVGAILFVALSAIGAGFREAAKAPLSSVSADVIITRGMPDGALPTTGNVRGAILPFGMTPISSTDLSTIFNTSGISGAAGALQIWDFGGTNYVTILGVDNDHSLLNISKANLSLASTSIGPEAILKDGLLSGRIFKAGDRGVAIADLHYARFYDLQPGDTVSIVGTSFDLIGIMEVKNSSQAAAANLYIPLADAQRMVGLSPDQVDQVYVQVASASQIDTVVNQLTSQINDLSVTTEDSMLQVMGGIGKVSARFSLVAAILGLVGGLLLAWAALGGLVNERRVEIGIMKAIGWQSRHVQKTFLIEAFILSLIGGVVGFFMGWGVALLLGQLPLSLSVAPATQTMQGMALVQTQPDTITLLARVDALTMALAVLASIVGGTFAGWTSSRKAASLKPAESLRQR